MLTYAGIKWVRWHRKALGRDFDFISSLTQSLPPGPELSHLIFWCFKNIYQGSTLWVVIVFHHTCTIPTSQVKSQGTTNKTGRNQHNFVALPWNNFYQELAVTSFNRLKASQQNWTRLNASEWWIWLCKAAAEPCCSSTANRKQGGKLATDAAGRCHSFLNINYLSVSSTHSLRQFWSSRSEKIWLFSFFFIFF